MNRISIECLPFSHSDTSTRCVHATLHHLTGKLNVRLIVDSGAEGLTLPAYLAPQLLIFEKDTSFVTTSDSVIERANFILPVLKIEGSGGKSLVYQQVRTQFGSMLNRWNVGLLGANLLFRKTQTPTKLWDSVRFENRTNQLVLLDYNTQTK